MVTSGGGNAHTLGLFSATTGIWSYQGHLRTRLLKQRDPGNEQEPS